MGNRTKRVAFIPVRGGSKSIPKKNIKKIAGKPLVYWVIDAALKSEVFDEIFISTNDTEIKDVVLKHPLNEQLNVINRGEDTATDTATTESAMLEFASNFGFDEIALIQATSPLLEASHLNEAFESFSKNDKVNSLLSVCRQERFIWQQSEEGFAKPFNYDPMNRPRRQDFDGFLVENGAFYITKREDLLESGSRLSGNIFCYEMPPETYFELDEPSDWAIIENLLQKKKDADLKGKLKNIKLFLTDVDGVLTDAGMYYSEIGDELKKFNTRDGKGIELLRENGIKVGIITSENTKIVTDRAKKLKVDYLYQGEKDGGKLKAAREMCNKLGITLNEVAYIGDDINDLSVINKVGFSACPEDAVNHIKKEVDYICNKKGGFGCVRELAEILIDNKLC